MFRREIWGYSYTTKSVSLTSNIKKSINTVLPCSLRDSSLNRLVKSAPNVLVHISMQFRVKFVPNELVHNSMQISRNILSSVLTLTRNWDPTCLVHFCQDTRHQAPTISNIKDMLTHRASSLISRNCYWRDFLKFQSSAFSFLLMNSQAFNSQFESQEFILDLFNRTIEWHSFSVQMSSLGLILPYYN